MPDPVTATAADERPCPRCNGTGVIHLGSLDAMADVAWSENRPHGYVAAIRDLRAADGRVLRLRAYKDAIDAAKERAGDA